MKPGFGWRSMAAVLLGLLSASAMAEKVTPLMAQPMAGLKNKEGLMLTVEYAPGEASTKHKHSAHVFVYVLEGSIVMQVDGKKEVTLTPGQTFYETTKDIHTVSKNASATQPAKFLVFMVKDKGVAPVLPAK